MPQGKPDSVDLFLESALDPYPEIDREVEAAVDRISKVASHLRRIGEHVVEGFGLIRSEFRMLLKLRISPGERMTAGELAEELVLSTGAMTKRLDSLERQGLVRRERDTHDRRSVFVCLTDAGRDKVDEAVDAQAAEEARVIGVLTSKERTALNDLLRKVLIELED